MELREGVLDSQMNSLRMKVLMIQRVNGRLNNEVLRIQVSIIVKALFGWGML